MGWFWGSSDEASTSTSGDAYNKLDPALREFLDKESPVRYRPSAAAANSTTAESQDSYRSQIGIAKPEASSASSSPTTIATSTPTTTTQSTSPSTAVPNESLYPDGRYAHLWKNYQPLSTYETTQRSDQDQLNDVIEAYNERKASIGRAAVENCVLEQMAEHDCFARGGMHAKMTMCRAENKVFNRCYTMQSRFLKALGYLGMERTAEEEERIQMHADKLYHEMLAREEAVKAAKEEGKPEPLFKPLLNNASAAEAMGVQRVPSEIAPHEKSVLGAIQQVKAAKDEAAPTQPPKAQGLDIYAADKRKEIEKRLLGKTKDERDLEIQLMVAESNASVEYAEKIKHYFDEEKRARADRKERGRETFGDSIKRVWGWDR